MAYFPKLPVYSTQTLFTDKFAGLNKGLSIADGEFSDMQNMTSDKFPVASTRPKRSYVGWHTVDGAPTSTVALPQGLIGTDKLIVLDNGHVYIDGEMVEGLTLSTDSSMMPKRCVSMGAYLCIWPDKKYVNTTNPDDCGSMGVKWSPAEGAVVSAMMCRKDGTNYDEESITVSDTAPADPVDQQFWLDTSGSNDVLKQYSAIYKEWVQVATTYIKIQADGIGKGFKVGDSIFLSGVAPQTQEAAAATESTETLTFATEDFNLTSSFTVTESGGAGAASYASRTKTFMVDGIPDGATITNSVIKFRTDYTRLGAALLTVNGESFAEGVAVEMPVEVAGNGEVNVKFGFRSSNRANGSGYQSNTLYVQDISLEVTYSVDGASGETSDSDLKQFEALNTTNILYGVGSNYIIVAGLLRRNATLKNTIVAELRIPDLDHVCEANNRIWGCSFSRLDGTLTNEIRCCALGDFRNWYLFDGTSMASYVASVGTDGGFTGAISLKGNPLFFKETCLHKVSGTQPSNFSINTTVCRGVQEGCERSLAIVGETLLYKARTDVMAYDGAMPYSVSEKLGTDKYTDASAGAYRDKYYICMRDASLRWHLYVFDTAKGLWHREDDSIISHFANVKGDLYIIQEDLTPARLMTVNDTSTDKEADYKWSLTFGTYGYAYEGQKYLSRFNIRCQLAAGSTLKMEIMYDSDGKWIDEGRVRCPNLCTFMIPVIPRRCDHCQIRLSGYGDIKLYSFARVLENGGDG
jgi:hypothetical protein